MSKGESFLHGSVSTVCDFPKRTIARVRQRAKMLHEIIVFNFVEHLIPRKWLNMIKKLNVKSFFPEEFSSSRDLVELSDGYCWWAFRLLVEVNCH